MRKLIIATTLAIIAGLGLTAVPAGADVLEVPYPDVLVKKAGAAEFKGDGITSHIGDGQTVKFRASAGQWTSTTWRLQNDGDAADHFFMRGDASRTGYRVRYLVPPGVDITGSVTDGKQVLLDTGQHHDIEVQVKATKRAPIGSQARVSLSMSTSSGDAFDVAYVVLTRK